MNIRCRVTGIVFLDGESKNISEFGTLIGFGTQYEELCNGVGQCTTAIVVLDNTHRLLECGPAQITLVSN